jgi:hypothetical protein
VFQSIPFNVVTKTSEHVALYLISVDCVAHQTNLVILVLIKLSLVVWVESILQSLYAFLLHNPKKVLEFVSLSKPLKTKGLKLL